MLMVELCLAGQRLLSSFAPSTSSREGEEVHLACTLGVMGIEAVGMPNSSGLVRH